MQPDDKLLIYGRIKTVLFPHLTRDSIRLLNHHL